MAVTAEPPDAAALGLTDLRPTRGGWQAWEPSLERTVFVRPAPPGGRTPSAIHPALAVVHRVTSDGRYWVEAAPMGPTLADAPAPRNQRQTIAHAVLAGLAAIHAAGGIHGQVGPAAVQRTADGAVLAGATGVGGIADDEAAAWRLIRGLGLRCGPVASAEDMARALRAPRRRWPWALLALAGSAALAFVATRARPPAPAPGIPEALQLDLNTAIPALDHPALRLTGWWIPQARQPAPALIVPGPHGGWWFARSDAPPGTAPGSGWYAHAGTLWPAAQGESLYLRGWLYNQPGWAQGHEIYVEFRLDAPGRLRMTRSLFCEPGGPFKFGFQDEVFDQVAPGADPWDRPGSADP